MDETARKASGVRNLRAMFENRDNSEESTPPQANRGRSGAPDSARTTQSPAPRPLNKVQTNFITVDKKTKSGAVQWGLKSINDANDTTSIANKKTEATSEQDNSEQKTDESNKNENTYNPDKSISPPLEPEMPRRRDSFSLHEDLPSDQSSIQARKASIAEEFRNRKQSLQVNEAVPEFAVETPALETPAVDGNRARHQLGYSEPPVPTTSANPDKQTNDTQPGVKLLPSDPKSEGAVTEGKALQGASLRNLTGGDAKSMRAAAVQGLKTTPAKATLAMRPTPSSASASNSPAQVASSNANKPLRSPPLQRTPASAAAAQRGPAVTSGNRNVSNVSAVSNASTAKPAAKATTSTTNGAPKPATSRSSATAPTASQTAKKATTAGSSAASTSGTGFHKPRPKSPTRPARLPASLMAPTASSISKVAGAENNTTTQSRRSSAGTVAQNKATAATKSRNETLKHTSSHSRPSVGPPPSSAAHKKPASSSHTTKPADDSFLARMMRPTAASSSKVVGHESQLSPPKPKTATTTPAHSRPATREKVHAEKKNDTPKKAEAKAEPERPKLEEKISEPISPKTVVPPKTETPKHHEPHVDPPKPSLPSHSVPKVVKTERTVSMTDMSSSDGSIKKLPPGAIPIPKIQKKKKPIDEAKAAPASPKSPRDVTDVPKEKKRDFLLEVREEEKRHRRLSERPSMIKNPTTIPESAEEVDEEIDDHQLPSGGSGDDAGVSGGSGEIPRTTPKQAFAPQKQLSPAKESPKKSEEDSLEQNAMESQNVDERDVDDVDIAASAPSPSTGTTTQRRLSEVAEKAMDYAAEAIDKAAVIVNKAAERKASEAEKKEEEKKVQGLAKGHALTSAMLNGSALDTDDEYTPSPKAERGNPFDAAAKSEMRGKQEREEMEKGEFEVKKELKVGEERVVQERAASAAGEGEGEAKADIEEETAREGDGDDRVGDVGVTALAS